MFGDLGLFGGLNIVSMIGLAVMLVHSLRVSYNTFAPFSYRKIMVIALLGLMPVVFYICFLDLLPIFIANNIVLILHGASPYSYIMEFTYQRLIIILPTSFSLLIFSGGMALLYMRKSMRFKWLLPVLLSSIVSNFCMLWFFGSYNPRLLPAEEQEWLYLADFLPSWTIWTVGFILFWRKRK